MTLKSTLATLWNRLAASTSSSTKTKPESVSLTSPMDTERYAVGSSISLVRVLDSSLSNQDGFTVVHNQEGTHGYFMDSQTGQLFLLIGPLQDPIVSRVSGAGDHSI